MVWGSVYSFEWGVTGLCTRKPSPSAPDNVPVKKVLPLLLFSFYTVSVFNVMKLKGEK